MSLCPTEVLDVCAIFRLLAEVLPVSMVSAGTITEKTSRSARGTMSGWKASVAASSLTPETKSAANGKLDACLFANGMTL